MNDEATKVSNPFSMGGGGVIVSGVTLSLLNSHIAQFECGDPRIELDENERLTADLRGNPLQALPQLAAKFQSQTAKMCRE